MVPVGWQDGTLRLAARFGRAAKPEVQRRSAVSVFNEERPDPSNISGTENTLTWFPDAVPMMISL